MDYGTGAIMAVPAHDERDREFARTFGLPIRQVIRPADGEVDELSRTSRTRRTTCSSTPASSTACRRRRAARDRREARAGGRGALRRSTTACATGASRGSATGAARSRSSTATTDGIVPVPDDQLPVVLPEVEDYRPKGDAAARPGRGLDRTCRARVRRRRRSARRTRWTRSSTRPGTSCATATRTTTRRRSTARAVDYWIPVDHYIGGIDHATVHLIYSRFFVKVLNDLGLLGFREPFAQLLLQRLGDAGGTKMSKRKGNVVGPGRLCRALRRRRRAASTSCSWARPTRTWSGREAASRAISRFLRRLWRVVNEVAERAPAASRRDGPLARKAHATIAKVTDDIGRRFAFNTAISAVMELVNELSRDTGRPRRAVRRRDGRLADPAVRAAHRRGAVGAARARAAVGAAVAGRRPGAARARDVRARRPGEREAARPARGVRRPRRGGARRARARVGAGAGAPGRRRAAADDRRPGQARQLRRLAANSGTHLVDGAVNHAVTRSAARLATCPSPCSRVDRPGGARRSRSSRSSLVGPAARAGRRGERARAPRLPARAGRRGCRRAEARRPRRRRRAAAGSLPAARGHARRRRGRAARAAHRAAPTSRRSTSRRRSPTGCRCSCRAESRRGGRRGRSRGGASVGRAGQPHVRDARAARRASGRRAGHRSEDPRLPRRARRLPLGRRSRRDPGHRPGANRAAPRPGDAVRRPSSAHWPALLVARGVRRARARDLDRAAARGCVVLAVAASPWRRCRWRATARLAALRARARARRAGGGARCGWTRSTRASSRRARRDAASRARDRAPARRRPVRRASSPMRARSATSAVREPVLLELPLGRSPPQGPSSRRRVRVAAPRPGGRLRRARAGSRASGVHVVLEASSWRDRRAARRDRRRRRPAPRPARARRRRPDASGERRGIVLGVVLGEDEGLSDELQDDFRASGLYHLLAVSGQNVTFIAAGVLGARRGCSGSRGCGASSPSLAAIAALRPRGRLAAVGRARGRRRRRSPRSPGSLLAAARPLALPRARRARAARLEPDVAARARLPALVRGGRRDLPRRPARSSRARGLPAAARRRARRSPSRPRAVLATAPILWLQFGRCRSTRCRRTSSRSRSRRSSRARAARGASSIRCRPPLPPARRRSRAGRLAGSSSSPALVADLPRAQVGAMRSRRLARARLSSAGSGSPRRGASPSAAARWSPLAGLACAVPSRRTAGSRPGLRPTAEPPTGLRITFLDVGQGDVDPAPGCRGRGPRRPGAAGGRRRGASCAARRAGRSPRSCSRTRSATTSAARRTFSGGSRAGRCSIRGSPRPGPRASAALRAARARRCPVTRRPRGHASGRPPRAARRSGRTDAGTASEDPNLLRRRSRSRRYGEIDVLLTGRRRNRRDGATLLSRRSRS